MHGSEGVAEQEVLTGLDGTRTRDAVVLGHLQAFADVGFWEHDLRTGSLYLSTQVFELLGIEEPTLEAYLAVVHPDDVALLREVHLRARTQPGPYRVRHRTRDGERVLQVRVQSVPDQTGRPVRYLGVVSDVTVEWRLEQALEQSTSARLTGLVAGGAVHDLKNVFAVVLGHLDLAAAAAERGEPPAPESMAAIRRAADRGLELTTQLLDVGRAEPVVARRVAVAELLRRLQITATTVLGRQVHLEVDPGSDGVDLVADEARLERALVDLLLNARDALPASGGRVRVSFGPADEALVRDLVAAGRLPTGSYGVLEVSDDGSGIEPDVLTQVTDPFFTTKRASGGSGVGLHTVARFAESAGGRLVIESEPGVGTTVRLVLPTRPALVPTRRRRDAIRIAVHGEDDQRVAAVARALEDSGFQVVRSTTTAAITRLLRTEPIDLVVTDPAGGREAPTELVRLAAATATAVLGVGEVIGDADGSSGSLDAGALAEVVDAVDRSLRAARQPAGQASSASVRAVSASASSR